jgi:predicted transglutaminase-like protease
MTIEKMIGCRYFIADTDEEEHTILKRLYKIVGIQNDTTLKVHDLINDKVLKIDKKTLEEENVLLEPDAYIMFSIARLQEGIEDVIVSMFKVSDMEQNNPAPLLYHHEY